MKKILTWLDINIEPVLVTILFYAMTLLLTVQVILRFFFNSGFAWGEEVARFIFIWLMYFSISYATRNHRHIKVTYLVNLLNEKAQKIVMIIVDLLFLVFLTFVFISSIKICQSVIEYGDKAVTVNISSNIIYGAGVVGYAFMMVRIIQGLIWKIRNFYSPMEKFENYTGVYTGADKICFAIKSSDKKTNVKKEE